MRRRLWIFCALSAVLSALSFFDGILVIAAFFAVIPAIVLAFAPDALLVGITLLIADTLSPPQPRARKRAIALAIAGLLLTLAAASVWCNRPLEHEIRAVTREDHDLQEPLTGTRNIAIQFITNERARQKSQRATPLSGGIYQSNKTATPTLVPSPARKLFCERLCLHLLFNGLADSVLVSSVPAAEGVFAPDPAEIGMRFQLAPAACRKPDIQTEDIAAPPYRLFGRDEEQGFAEQVSARMIAGACVIGEPARLSEAQIIVQENPEVLPSNHVPSRPSSARNIRHLIFRPAHAARLSIYRVQNGNIEEVFRQTEVEAYPLLPILLLGPVITGDGGIGISEGFLRWKRIYSEYNLRDVLKSRLGMEIARIAR